jgi:8-amino-7-oxononanoate synthase
LRWHALDSPDVIVVASLAKAFGAPIAMLGGSNDVVARLEATSGTRVHCSPPSVASLHAAAHALAVNRRCGDRLRSRLAARVLQFQRELRAIGLTAIGGVFPVQTLAAVQDEQTVRLHRALTRAGVHSVLRRDHGHSHPRMTFILTAHHTPDDIHALVEMLARAYVSTPTQIEDVEARP